jgi:hypothetical protein
MSLGAWLIVFSFRTDDTKSSKASSRRWLRSRSMMRMNIWIWGVRHELVRRCASPELTPAFTYFNLCERKAIFQYSENSWACWNRPSRTPLSLFDPTAAACKASAAAEMLTCDLSMSRYVCCSNVKVTSCQSSRMSTGRRRRSGSIGDDAVTGIEPTRSDSHIRCVSSPALLHTVICAANSTALRCIA